jgi:predicted deacylase
VHLALAGVLALASVFAKQTDPRQERLGLSAEARPIDGYWLGDAAAPAVIVVGGIHGGPELNSSELVWQLLDHFADAGLPPHLRALFVPEANPDGIAEGTRELSDGVDPNRNFPTVDWQPGTYGPGTWLPDGGGGWPLSEPETIALAHMIERIHPRAVLSFHSAAGIAMGGASSDADGMLDLYTAMTGYPSRPFNAYPVTGDFAQWCDEIGIPTVEVELSDHLDPELDRNLAGIEAVFDQLSSGATDQSY